VVAFGVAAMAAVLGVVLVIIGMAIRPPNLAATPTEATTATTTDTVPLRRFAGTNSGSPTGASRGAACLNPQDGNPAVDPAWPPNAHPTHSG
jgi:hypothetical protein